MHAHGNAASTVLNSQAPIREERHDDLIIEAGEMLVHGIVHHLPDAVVERIAVVRVTEVHPWPNSDCLEPFEELDVVRSVGV